RIVAATVRGAELRLEQAVVWEEEQSPNIAEAEALGRRLRERLKSAGITPAPVLACVGRDRVILREVRYPSVAAAEEPAIVRFQVLKELTDSASEVIIDYTPLDEGSGNEERRALVLTVRRELLTAYRALCHAAGLKLLALTPRPFGTLACLRESVRKWEGSGAFAEAHPNGSSQTAMALLTATDNWSEFCLVRGDTLLLARSLPAGPTLPAEVRRNIATYITQSPRHAVSALYLAGNGENAGLETSLHETLGIPVRSFDPFVGAEGTALPRQNRGAFAGAVGLLRIQGEGRPLPINFASPKQPRVARDPNKQRLAIGAGVAAALFLGITVYCYSQIAALDGQLDQLQFKQLAYEQQKPQIEEAEDQYKKLSEWRRGNIPWLDEFYDLTARFPDLHTMQLFELEGRLQQSTSSKDTAKDKPIAQMKLTFGTTSYTPQALDDLLNQMREEKGHYVPSPKRPISNGVMKDPAFPIRFEAQIEVDNQPRDKFKLVVQGPSAPPPGSSRIRPVAATLPAGSSGSSGLVMNRNRVAMPEKGSMVRVVASPHKDEPPRPGANRALTPKSEPVQPAPVHGVDAPAVQQMGEAMEAILDAARSQEQDKAQEMIQRVRRAQEGARVRQPTAAPPAPAPSAPATAPAPKKGNTP
ncbi:MAG TPA: hypothetical protein VKU02_22410, partial [Gemmataceae bacterium]|nr:hypothetical protein [Gemmataceae bacterium]